MMEIRKKLVQSVTANKVTSGKGNTKKKICIHETDNTGAKANADAHSRLQYNGNSRQASWHWQVDDKEAVQSFDHSYRCWAAGNTKGNNEAIHIEICVNSDGNYLKAVENAAKLTAKIMKDENISIKNIVQHNYYSGKNCPRIMRAGKKVTWNSFLQLVEKNLKGNGGLTVSQYNELKNEIEKLKGELNKKVNSKVEAPVSDWAKEFYDWAVKEGLTDGSNPRGALTREQAFTMFKRFHEKFGKCENCCCKCEKCDR